MARSKVFFSSARGKPGRNKFDRISELLAKVELGTRFHAGDLVALKVHWGELGNADFIPSFFVHHVASTIESTGATPFVTDTNTLYRGSRFMAVDNLKTAASNGFTQTTLGCPVLIADGLRGLDYREVPVEGRHVRSARIASGIADASGMVVISHVKGHMVFGFGGALKNLGMGCAAAAAKQFLHGEVRPVVKESSCTGCGQCLKHCRFDAITLNPTGKGARRVAHISHEACQGCGECTVVCPEAAIPINWKGQYQVTQEKTAEYARAAVAGKEGKVIYLNFLVSITPDCDCCSWSDAPIVPDIGYLISDDPVAIDQASVDLVNNFKGFPDRLQLESGLDRFRLHHDLDWSGTLAHGEFLGMGTRDYELIEL